MADANWRTNRSIQQAKAAAVALGQTAVVMLMIDDKAGTMEIATYGIDGPRCTRAGKIGDFVYRAAMTGLREGRIEA